MKHIDITNVPELAQLADEVRRTQEPRMLRRGSQDLALVLPVAAFQANSDDIWAEYSPERARRALRASAGALVGVDLEKLLDDIRAEREQGSIGRPA